AKVFPARMSNIKINDAGAIVDYEWARDEGVDVMYGTRRIYGALLNATVATAPVAKSYTIANSNDKDAIMAFFDQEGFSYTVDGNVVKVTYPKGCMYINTNDYNQIMDLKYVNLRALAVSQTGGRAENDTYFYPSSSSNAVAGTGSFWSRPDSDSDILTYYEMCFIKAEVNMRMGNAAAAYTAYIEGINASFNRMQTKLQDWAASGTTNPDQHPMSQTEINAYLASAAVAKNASQLTMADIMLQKTIAMGINMETWNDMRRFNYGAGNIANFGQVYLNYVRPAEFKATNKIPGTSPTQENYWFRRYSQCSHETNYNKDNTAASNPLALTFENGAIWSDPVWWDKAE
ncbi:MAG TPA: SusD/RagB family nutrient-binding outer membrane lipoprotein, partial [Bacteroidales bacterium]|nr:SusD/RagB family nutrient-binding outer membrane lipoprotein [Bacteroidales bacterium]